MTLSGYDPWGLPSTSRVSWMTLGTWVSFWWVGRIITGLYFCFAYISANSRDIDTKLSGFDHWGLLRKSRTLWTIPSINNIGHIFPEVQPNHLPKPILTTPFLSHTPLPLPKTISVYCAGVASPYPGARSKPKIKVGSWPALLTQLDSSSLSIYSNLIPNFNQNLLINNVNYFDT